MKDAVKKKPLTQLQRAKLIRERYKRWYPILDELKTDLGKLLDDAQNRPEDGGAADGTIKEVVFEHLRRIHAVTCWLLAALDKKDKSNG
jgi:hypothetical protein